MTTDQITLELALELVELERGPEGWRIKNFKGTISTIRGRHWMFVETPRERLKRLIEEDADYTQLLEALEQLEDSNA